MKNDNRDTDDHDLVCRPGMNGGVHPIPRATDAMNGGTMLLPQTCPCACQRTIAHEEYIALVQSITDALSTSTPK